MVEPKVGADALHKISETLDEAHHFWRECQTRYHDPETFRYSLNALIQTLRNVTFRLQAHKTAIVGFDEWYAPWQLALRADPVMTWINDARIKVVKKGGLSSSSFARVRLVSSYLKAYERTLRLPADLPMGALIAAAVRGVPEDRLGFSLLEIERHWEVKDLPGEVLGRLAEAMGKYHAMLDDLARRLNGQASLGSPVELMKSAALPRCTATWAPTIIRINPLTGAEYEQRTVTSEVNEHIVAKSAKRYGAENLAIRPLSDRTQRDPIEYARSLVPVARRIVEKDGGHIPMLFLHHPVDGWSPPRVLLAEDQLDKYLLWRRVGQEVAAGEYDGLVAIAEVWLAEAPDDVATPYLQLEEQPGRKEALVVYGVAKDGRIEMTASMIRRRFGRVRLAEPTVMVPGTIGFLQPVFRAWGWPAVEGPLVGPPRRGEARDQAE